MPTGVNATDTFCLDPAYSTTRLVTQETPVFDKPSDVKFQSMLFLPPNSERKGEGGLRTMGYFKQSLPDKPLITVITVVFNDATYLEDTIKSVINQTYDNVEYIIVDGGSTDGSVGIIKKYEGLIDYWVSEQDGGIYDAMNKGIEYANGEWILFLGSDDRFINNNIVKTFFENKKYNDILLVYGDVQYENMINPFISKLCFLTLLYNTIHHQGAFYNKSLFYGPWRYDDSITLFADYELNLRIMLNKLKTLKLNYVVTICSDNGLSRTNLKKLLLETNAVRGKYYNYYVNLLLNIFFAVKVFVTYVRHK